MPVFRELHAFLKYLSKLKAIRGKTPKSSSKVNIGKNIAIGGNITDITHVTVWYIPSITNAFSHKGAPKYSNSNTNFSPIHPKNVDNNSDG